jgi:hypothetical protein
MPYLLDTNIFIEAKNAYYGFDFCPAFWEWLVAKNREGLVFSIEKVGDEISAGEDELATWSSELVRNAPIGASEIRPLTGRT